LNVRIGADYNNAFGAKQLSALLNLPALFNIGAIIFLIVYRVENREDRDSYDVPG
jgi:hypothetical protein